MLMENRPNIVVDDNYRMFVKEMQRRYAERGAFVYIDNEAIEQERKDAHARAMAPDAYRISSVSGDAARKYRSGEKFMTTDDYLQYFGKCHDTFDAVNYYTLHKEQEVKENEEPKILVNRKMVEKLRGGQSRVAYQAPVVEKESFWDRISEFLSSMSRARKRAMTGMAAAALSLVFVIGGMTAFARPEADANYEARSAEVHVVDVAEAEEDENLLKG